MALDRVQPVPWVLGFAMRLPRNHLPQPSRRDDLINPRVGAGGYCYRVVFTANGQRMERRTNDSFWFHHDGQQGKTVLVWYNPASPVVERKSWETEVLAAAMGVLATALLLIR